MRASCQVMYVGIEGILHSYRKYKGMSYVPSAVHHAIRWSKTDPKPDPIEDDVEWKILKKTNKSSGNLGSVAESSTNTINSFIPAKGSVPLQSKKRKLKECNIHLQSKKLKQKDCNNIFEKKINKKNQTKLVGNRLKIVGRLCSKKDKDSL
jgi:hypothetical protein